MHPCLSEGQRRQYINIKSDESCIQSNPIPPNPRKLDGVSGHTTIADAEGRSCLSHVSP